MKYEGSLPEFTEQQKEVFDAWTRGCIVEYLPVSKTDWIQADKSLKMDKRYQYRMKMKPGSTPENPRPYKVRGEFRFRWRIELQEWLSGEQMKFYDDKKKEWHTVYPDQHIWDCVTIYENK